MSRKFLPPTRRLTRSLPAAEARREFLRRMASAGMAFGLPPLLANCGGGNDARPVAGVEVGAEPPAAMESRTLFFNFAHEAYAGKRYFYEAAGRSYDLVPVTENPQVLAAARAGNSFLSAVPDAQITHHVEAVQVPTDSTMLTYVGTDLDRAAGTWTMAGVYLQTSSGSIAPAHALIAARLAERNQTLVTAAQRLHYGLPAASSATDLLEQSVLLDPPTHAAALIGVHPDLMSLDPVASAVVQHGHLQQSIFVSRLARRITLLGAARPADANAPGWATLTPFVDPRSGTQAHVTTGPDAGRLQYQTLWHPDVAATAGQGIAAISVGVKDDETLGADITAGPAPNGGRGVLWMRRDGSTNVEHTPGATAAAGSGPTMTLASQTSQGGITVKATSTTDSNGRPVATVTVENWYLRYLGVFVQFLDAANPPNVIALADLPEYAADKIVVPPRGTDKGGNNQDDATTMFMAMVGPVSTVMGIPIEAEAATGQATFTITIPQKATTVRVLAGGLGGGSNNYPQTLADGAAMTVIFNYGFTAILAAAGAGPTLDAMTQLIISVLGDLVAELAAAIADRIEGNDWTTPAFWIDQGEALGWYLLSYVGGKALEKIVGFIVSVITLAVAEKVIPIANMIMAGISALIGAGDLITSTVEIALSPWTYVNDLVYSYDLRVALTPASGTFPAAADTCRVTAMFDDGTPHVQTLALSKTNAAPPPVVFLGVPLGGNLNVSAAFSQSATVAAAGDILLGKGSTGSQPNTGGALTLAVEQIDFPIGPTTTYRHRQKTMVDDSDRHVWATAPAPTTTASADCSDAGTICGLRSITVRQQTATDTGYLGYAWQARNADPSRAPSCNGQGAGQLDQIANLATGTNPQSGYALSSCGFNNVGVRVAYSLLSRGPSNFYLDTNDLDAPLLRQVALDGSPTIDGPGPQQAWGALNLSSDLLLLHPAGHAVSVNGANHKIETHRLPLAAASDAVAKVSMLAEVKSGKGTRPGLIDTPVAAAIGADGTLLILEAGNNRIQALNLGANPVQHFSKQKVPYFLSLDAATSPDDGWTHLDMAVEFTGFIYVLSTNSNTGLYQMNIYHPAQADAKPVATATTMNAAKLTVDFWRNVYTLNYEVIQRSDPSNGTPPPVTEPSVSLWTPCDVGQTCPV